MKISAKIKQYTYPLEKRESLRNISIEVEQGSVVAIIGNNGSGKTSLCNILRGFIPQFYKGTLEGNVYIDTKNLNDFDQETLSTKIGYVSQNPFVQMTGSVETVFEELAFGLENSGMNREQMIEKVEHIINLFGLESIKYQNPLQLSGGQKQKVALAAVIAMDPDIYIIDEPTSQLDPIATQEIQNIILNLKNMGKTIILVEHKMSLVRDVADYIYVLDKGTILLEGSPYTVFNQLIKRNMNGLCPQTIRFAKACQKQGLIDGSYENLPIYDDELVNMIDKGSSYDKN